MDSLGFDKVLKSGGFWPLVIPWNADNLRTAQQSSRAKTTIAERIHGDDWLRALEDGLQDHNNRALTTIGSDHVLNLKISNWGIP